MKYRALLRAQQKVQKTIPNGKAVLVIERTLPGHLERISELLDIEVFNIDNLGDVHKFISFSQGK